MLDQTQLMETWFNMAKTSLDATKRAMESYAEQTEKVKILEEQLTACGEELAMLQIKLAAAQEEARDAQVIVSAQETALTMAASAPQRSDDVVITIDDPVTEIWERDVELAEARADLGEVQQMLADIERLKYAPKVAALQLESPAEITNRIALALRAAGLSKSNLLKEEPLDPQRIQRTDFDLRTTTIDLTPTTLPKIIKFCDALRDEETGTIVRDITLTEPQSGENGGNQENWEAELVLTQMIFSPKSR